MIRASAVAVLMHGLLVSTLASQSTEIVARRPHAENSVTAVYRVGRFFYTGRQNAVTSIDFVEPMQGARLAMGSWPDMFECTVLFGSQSKTTDLGSARLEVLEFDLSGWSTWRSTKRGRSDLRITTPMVFGYRSQRVRDATPAMRPVKVARGALGLGTALSSRASESFMFSAHASALFALTFAGSQSGDAQAKSNMGDYIGDAGVAVHWPRTLRGRLGFTSSASFRAQTWSMPAKEAFNSTDLSFPFRSNHWSLRAGLLW